MSPQGKYLYEFFVIKSKDGFLLDCYGKFTEELIKNLTKYKLRSKVEINNLSNKFVVGIISLEKFKELQINEKKNPLKHLIINQFFPTLHKCKNIT